MKKLFYILAVAAMAAGVIGCQKVKEEDAFSKAPVAPELYAHGDILITNNTMDEDVTFSWSNYRFLPESLDFTLYVAYGDGDPVVFATTKDMFVTMAKKDFRTLLFQKLAGLPENDLFTLRFYVSVVSGEKEYRSQDVVLSVYGNGDAVAPVIEEVMEDTELDPANPEGEVEVLSWEPARLVYGEAVTYDVYLSLNPANPAPTSVSLRDVAEPQKLKLTEEPITGTSYTTTVDELNEAIISLGGVEGAVNDVTFEVVAMCESLPNGVSAATVQVAVTTYVATFPEVLYIPGSHQGWDPATAPTIKLSKVTKGFYQGIIDLTTSDGSEVQFKFSPVPEWKDDFGGKVDVTENGSGEYPVAIGTLGVSDNIAVPSGVYYIEMSKKFNTIKMVQLNTLSLIGAAIGDWSKDVDLAYDSEKQVFMATTTFQPGEYKLRFNHNWDMALGVVAGSGDYTLSGGNMETDKEGEYRFELSVATVPFTIKFVNTSFPDQLYVPGSHNEWNHSATVLAGNGEGQYQGFASLGGEWGLKFTPAPNWDKGEFGLLQNAVPAKDDKGFTVYEITDTNAGNIMEGTEVTYGLAIVDLNQFTFKFQPITSVGIIGSFADNAWSSDKYSMTYSSETDSWKVEGAELMKGTEWKFRMNEGWDVNLGGDLDNLVQDGDNITLSASGVYTVELFLATTPYRAVLTKTGDSTAPEWEDAITVAGDYSGHSWSADNDMHLNHKGNGMFKGAVTMYDATYGFKFVHRGAWFGMSEAEGLNFTLVSGDAGQNMMVDNGTYVWTVNMAENTASAELVTTVGVIGSFNSWGSDVEMTFDSSTLTYSAQVTLAAGDEFKIRFNGEWTHSLGGDMAALTYDGSNIKVDEAGTYTLVLDMKTGPYATLSMTK